MKKDSIFKGLFITAILCIVAVSACKQEPAVQKKIVVTGIPAQHNGRIGFTGLSSNNTSTLASSPPAAINSGTVNTSLYDYDAPGFSVPFTGSGTYMVILVITDSSLTTVWQGVIFSKSITAETTTIQFNEFIDMTSSVQQTPFSVRSAIRWVLKELKE